MELALILGSVVATGELDADVIIARTPSPTNNTLFRSPSLPISVGISLDPTSFVQLIHKNHVTKLHVFHLAAVSHPLVSSGAHPTVRPSVKSS